MNPGAGHRAVGVIEARAVSGRTVGLVLVGLVWAVGCAERVSQPWPARPAATSRAAVGPDTPAAAERWPASVPRSPLVPCLSGPSTAISLSLVRARVFEVLQALANHGQLNMVIDQTIHNRVTVELHEVPLGQAIEAIAAAAGLRIEVEDCVVFVVPN